MGVPTDTVDGIVHPTKLEVRFQESGRIYKQLLGMLRNRFLTTDLTATFRPQVEAAEQRIDAPHTQPHPLGYAPEFKPFPGGSTNPLGSTGSGPSSSAANDSGWSETNVAAGSDFKLNAPAVETQQRLDLAPDVAVPVAAPASGEIPLPAEVTEDPSAVGSASAMQVHNRYLVTANEDGIVVIDQHALHERVIYEQLREKVLQKEVEKQRLLVPEPVQLSPTEFAAVLQSKELLADLGIDVEDFGGDTVLVSSYPAMLANFNPSELIRQLSEQLTAGNKTPDPRDLLDEILHMISCKAAIKAGDRLAPEEIDSLIELRHLVQDSHHCPHGRPTTLVFTQKELDKRFQRT